MEGLFNNQGRNISKQKVESALVSTDGFASAEFALQA